MQPSKGEPYKGICKRETIQKKRIRTIVLPRWTFISMEFSASTVNSYDSMYRTILISFPITLYVF